MTYSQYHKGIIIEFAGASRYSPCDHAGCGWVIYAKGENGSKCIAEGKEFLGANISKNKADYSGLYEALAYLSRHDIECHGLYVHGDSQIVINQLGGSYQLRQRYKIEDYYYDVRNILKEVVHDFAEYVSIDRSRNERAGDLANEAIDEAKRKRRKLCYNGSSSVCSGCGN